MKLSTYPFSQRRAAVEQSHGIAQRTIRHGHRRICDRVVDDLVVVQDCQGVGTGLFADEDADDPVLGRATGEKFPPINNDLAQIEAGRPGGRLSHRSGGSHDDGEQQRNCSKPNLRLRGVGRYGTIVPVSNCVILQSPIASFR